MMRFTSLDVSADTQAYLMWMQKIQGWPSKKVLLWTNENQKEKVVMGVETNQAEK